MGFCGLAYALVSNQHLRRNAGIEGKHVVEREFETEHLIAYGVENLCEEDLTTFVAEDFETPQEMLVCQEPIGFFC